MIKYLRSAEAMEVEKLIACCYERLGSMGNCVDIGAHMGFHTKRMRESPNIGHVYAVEANPELLDGLQKLCDHYDRLKLYGKALAIGDQSEVTFKISSEHLGRGGIKDHHIWERIDPSIEFTEITVPAISLDQLLAHELDNRCDFIKMDIEGAEISILVASVAIWNCRPLMVMENSVHAPGLANLTNQQWLEFVAGKNYALLDFDLNRIDASHQLHSFNHVWLAPLESVTQFVEKSELAYQEFMRSR